jgi:hypothetical protein
MMTASKHWVSFALILLAATFLLTGCGSTDERMKKDFQEVTKLDQVKTETGLVYSEKLDRDERLYFYKGDLKSAQVALSKAISRVRYQAGSEKQVVFEVSNYYGILEKGSYENQAGTFVYLAREDRARNRFYPIFVPHFGSGSIRMSGSSVNKKTTTLDTGSYGGGTFDDDSDDDGGTSIFNSGSNTVKGGSTGVGK